MMKLLSHYVISFSNDGAGIPEDESEKLFTVFHRGTTSREIEGTGMGLAIVKALAERHGGSVWLKSGVDKKVTFCISIAKKLQGQNSTFDCLDGQGELESSYPA